MSKLGMLLVQVSKDRLNAALVGADFTDEPDSVDFWDVTATLVALPNCTLEQATAYIRELLPTQPELVQFGWIASDEAQWCGRYQQWAPVVKYLY